MESKKKKKNSLLISKKKICSFTRRFFPPVPFAIIPECQQNPNGGHLKRAKETESKKEAKPCCIVRRKHSNRKVRR